MAILFDAVTRGEGASVSSISFSHTATGSDLVAVAVVSIFSTLGTSVTDVTYNAVSFTAVPSGGLTASNRTTALYYLVNPATGANTFEVTFSNASANDIGVAILSLTGVDQSTPLGTANTSSGSGTTPSVIVSAATGDLVVDGLTIEHAGTLTVGAGQTERFNEIASSGFIKHAASTEPGAASVTMSWSDSIGGNWVMAAVPLKPKAAAGGGSVPVIQAQYRMRRAA